MIGDDRVLLIQKISKLEGNDKSSNDKRGTEMVFSKKRFIVYTLLSIALRYLPKRTFLPVS